MTRSVGIGKTGMALAVVVAGAMCVLSYLLSQGFRVSGELGICLPSPNMWPLQKLVSWILATLLLGAMTLGSILLNRRFNFIRSTQPVLPAMFVVLVASNPMIVDHLSSSLLVCAVNMISLALLFDCHRQRNATQQMFVIGSLVSLGSMCQYAFLPYVFAYVGSAMVMKVFRIKEFLAMGMGLVAPYWVGVGLGLIGLDRFNMPEFTDLFNGFAQAPDLFILLVSVSLAVFLAVVFGLNNLVRLYAGNSRVNAMNLSVSFVGLISIGCIIVDFSNMLAYIATLYFTLTVQLANFCALSSFRKEWIVVAVPAFIYVSFFIILLLA